MNLFIGNNVNVKLNFFKYLQLGILLIPFYLYAKVDAKIYPLDKVVVIVNNDIIMQSQLDRRVQQFESNIDKEFQKRLISGDVLRKQILEGLIIESLQLQLGKKMGIYVSDKELNDSLMRISDEKNISINQLREGLINNGISYRDIRRKVKNEIIIRRVQDAHVYQRTKVTESEIDNLIKSKLGGIQLSKEFYLSKVVIPLSSQAHRIDVEKAYKGAVYIYNQLISGIEQDKVLNNLPLTFNHIKKYEAEWYKAINLPSNLTLLFGESPIDSFTPPIRLSDGIAIFRIHKTRDLKPIILEQFNVRHILIKSGKNRSSVFSDNLIMELYNRVVSGESFGSLARTYSDDLVSRANGGALSWIDPNSLVPEFRKTVLTSPRNTVSKPFKTPYGWHILEVTDQRVIDRTPKIRRQWAAQLLYKSKYKEELEEWIQELLSSAYIDFKKPSLNTLSLNN